MAKNDALKSINGIKVDFLAVLADEANQPSYEDVIEFGSRLQDEVGMDPGAAAHTLTSWAVEAGCFGPDNADQAEGEATEILEDANS